jgi:hypothetical protein
VPSNVRIGVTAPDRVILNTLPSLNPIPLDVPHSFPSVPCTRDDGKAPSVPLKLAREVNVCAGQITAVSVNNIEKERNRVHQASLIARGFGRRADLKNGIPTPSNSSILMSTTFEYGIQEGSIYATKLIIKGIRI